MKLLLFLSMQLTVISLAQGAECLDLSLDKAIKYCNKVYGQSCSRGASNCRLGVTQTYEQHLIGNTSVTRDVVCSPYFLRSCESGHNVFIGFLNRCNN